ncbi:MAG: NADP-dependent isocitrate dehydrogenase, partial [Flavobacteriaceae bacterium]
DLMIYANALGDAVERLLNENLGPQRSVGSLDTRGSHFYLVKFWIDALAGAELSPSDKERFSKLSAALSDQSARILDEINQTQGRPHNIGGYYAPNAALANQAMRPSATLNQLIASF